MLLPCTDGCREERHEVEREIVRTRIKLQCGGYSRHIDCLTAILITEGRLDPFCVSPNSGKYEQMNATRKCVLEA